MRVSGLGLTVFVLAACGTALARSGPTFPAPPITAGGSDSGALDNPAVETVVGHAGPAALIDGFSPWTLRDEASFRVEWRGLSGRPTHVPLAPVPPGLGPDARFGAVFLADRDMLFALVRTPEGFSVHVDDDRDGDLAGATVLPLVPGEAMWSAEFRRDTGEDTQPLLLRFAIRPPDGEAMPDQIGIFSSTTRSGVLRIADRDVAFALYGRNGLYGAPYDLVAIDLDGDGELPVSDPRADETFRVADGGVALLGRSWAFEVDPSGDTLTLRADGRTLPARESLRRGAPAPPIEAIDLDGEPRSLARLRGSTVLLYFWGTWCMPCVKQTPRLVELHEAYGGRGFEIIAVNFRDRPEVLREYLAEHGIGWPQISVREGDELLRRYRVDAYPTTFLIDAEGTIVAHNPPLDEVERYLRRTAARAGQIYFPGEEIEK